MTENKIIILSISYLIITAIVAIIYGVLLYVENAWGLGGIGIQMYYAAWIFLQGMSIIYLLRYYIDRVESNTLCCGFVIGIVGWMSLLPISISSVQLTGPFHTIHPVFPWLLFGFSIALVGCGIPLFLLIIRDTGLEPRKI